MNEDAYNSIHDVILEITGDSPTQMGCLNVYKTMPESTKALAKEWGWNDTEVRDSIFDFASEFYEEDEEE